MNSKKRPLVSVIVPTFNRKNVLCYTIESILSQTYDNLELIIVDDCSTDDTRSLVMDYASKDDRVHYYRLKENKKACYARNYGFEKSSGDYIALMDSDDLCHKDKIEKQLKFLLNGKYDFCFCGINRVEKDGSSYFYPMRRIDFSKNIYKQELMENRICSVAMFMKRKVFETIKFDVELRRYQDWDFGIRVCKEFIVGFLNEALVDSYIRNDSITSMVSNHDSILNIFKKYEKDIVSDSVIYSYFLTSLGDSIRKSNLSKANEYYKKSIKIHFSIKTFIKTMLCYLKIHF